MFHMALLGEGDTAWPAHGAFHHKQHRPRRGLPSTLHGATARGCGGAEQAAQGDLGTGGCRPPAHSFNGASVSWGSVLGLP